MSIVNTRIQAIRAESNIDKYEQRASMYGATDLFLKESDNSTGIITPQLKAKAETSIGSTLETPVYDRKEVTVSNARSVTIADDENTSQMVQFTFVTLSAGFTMVPSNFHNNEMGYHRDFAVKIKALERGFATELETLAIAALEANKSLVFEELLGYVNTSGDVSIPLADRGAFLGHINTIMMGNDYFDNLSIVGSLGLHAHVADLAQNGLYNATNKTLQFLDKDFYFSRFIDAGTDYGKLYAVNQGSIGMMVRYEREALNWPEGKVGPNNSMWGIDRLPYLDIPVGYYYYESVGDQSAFAGTASADNTRALKEHFGFSADYCFITAYNSDSATLASPIAQFSLATT